MLRFLYAFFFGCFLDCTFPMTLSSKSPVDGFVSRRTRDDATCTVVKKLRTTGEAEEWKVRPEISHYDSYVGFDQPQCACAHLCEGEQGSDPGSGWARGLDTDSCL